MSICQKSRARWTLFGVALLAGCASSGPAPVVERAPSRAVEKAAAPAPVEPKAGHYLVKKGDTLRSIALDHGQDYKDLAAWNSLDNPNLIRVGQELRVVPPEAPKDAEGAIAEVRPIAPPVQIESRTAAVAPSPVTVEAMKREPKGGTQPYSDAAWAQLQKPTTAALAPAPAAAPPGKPEIAVKPAVAADIDWAWPSSQKVTAVFSDSANKGLDFEAPAGDAVLAAAAGKVTLVTNSLRGYGNLIVIKHNMNWLSVYAHNSKMVVTEGQPVSKGQKIAEVGSSDSDRPKLHFEIRREGKPIDPAKLLPPR